MTNTSLPRPLLHIGYHKTGTTWLQNHLFVCEEAGFCTPFKRQNEIPRLLVFPGPFSFDLQACRDYFSPKLNAAREKNLVPVLSAERFSGSPHAGGYDNKQTAERLAQVFPDAKILIVVREQNAMICSTYKQYVRVGGTASLRDYLDPPFYRTRLPLRMPLFQFDYFCYHALVEYYRSLFDEDNVLVLPYELFRAQPQEFVGRITRFAGGKTGMNFPYNEQVNFALSASAVALKRRLNVIAKYDPVNPNVVIRKPSLARLIDRFITRVDALVSQGKKKKWDAEMKSVIQEMSGEMFRESNRRLNALMEDDLAQYHYKM
jgi:hypothetical protein